MPCFQPLKAYRSVERNAQTGKYGLTFNGKNALIEGSQIRLPCGQCVGCRLDKARQWAIRCEHEAAMHDRNCFITLTYDQVHVPEDFSVRLRDWQLFMKRLRKRVGHDRVRFLATGEYGDNGLRPHYHALLFGFDFADKRHWTTRRDNRCYKSEMLEDVWGMGQCEIGTVTYKSSSYVARYCMKKMTGTKADEHYFRISPVDGKAYRVATEFCVMSRRPGVGSTWFDRYAADAFPSDFLVVDGRKVRPPDYYWRKLAEEDQDPVKRARRRAQLQSKLNNTPERLAVREELLSSRVNRLQRTLQ
ncbi:MAG: replication initiator protein [Microviridae sp.]|nr:MAG: replication initiator protein [Microviridae sp.]